MSIDDRHSDSPNKRQRTSQDNLQNIGIDPVIDLLFPPVVAVPERQLTDVELDRCISITEGNSPESFVNLIRGRHRLTLDQINADYDRYIKKLRDGGNSDYEDLTRRTYHKLKTVEGFSQLQAAYILGVSKSKLNRLYNQFLNSQGK